MLLYLENSTRKEILSALWLDLCHLWLILGVFSNICFIVLFRTRSIPGLGAVKTKSCSVGEAHLLCGGGGDVWSSAL